MPGTSLSPATGAVKALIWAGGVATMPEISQRTAGKLIEALKAFVPDGLYTHPEIRDFWRGKLFEWGFPPWFREYALKNAMNWTAIIPDLFVGKIVTENQGEIGEFLCNQTLRHLVVTVLEKSEDARTKDTILRSLQLDGFNVPEGKLQPIDGPVSAEKEKSRLLVYLESSKFGRKVVISKHIRDAEDLFAQGKHHPSIGEARSALQAVIEETVTLLEQKLGKRSGGGMKNQIEFLAPDVLSEDECKAVLAAWGFLCSGNHPGMSDEDAGRIGMILCLEFIQILLIKGKTFF